MRVFKVSSPIFAEVDKPGANWMFFFYCFSDLIGATYKVNYIWVGHDSNIQKSAISQIITKKKQKLRLELKVISVSGISAKGAELMKIRAFFK